MDYKEWEPIYEEILADFGFSKGEDERAARILSGMLGEKSQDLTPLRELISGRDVLVCGNGPSLDKELERIEFEKYIIIAADGATSGLLQKGKVPHIIVTDLDGKVGDEIEANRRGALMVVHAHGDNIGALLRFVPKLKNVLGTTQAEPIEKLHNFGGFTDGDRCVFLARALGARSIILVGFDFEDPKVGAIKRKKLRWAKKLIKRALGSRA